MKRNKSTSEDVDSEAEVTMINTVVGRTERQDGRRRQEDEKTPADPVNGEKVGFAAALTNINGTKKKTHLLSSKFI